jgi:hypothetical protein
MTIVKVGGGIGDVDRPVSRDVYRISSDEFQYFGIQIRRKLILRRCGDGEREERNTQCEGKDVHRGRASHLCTAQMGQSEGGRTAIYLAVEQLYAQNNYKPRGIAAHKSSIKFQLEAVGKHRNQENNRTLLRAVRQFFEPPPVICKQRIYEFVCFFSRKRNPTTLT